MIQLHVVHGPNFPISHSDQMDIYELYAILKRRGRLETERLSADLEINKKMRDVANTIDIEQRHVDRRARESGGYGL